MHILKLLNLIGTLSETLTVPSVQSTLILTRFGQETSPQKKVKITSVWKLRNYARNALCELIKSCSSSLQSLPILISNRRPSYLDILRKDSKISQKKNSKYLENPLKYL